MVQRDACNGYCRAGRETHFPETGSGRTNRGREGGHEYAVPFPEAKDSGGDSGLQCDRSGSYTRSHRLSKITSGHSVTLIRKKNCKDARDG